MTLVQNEPKKIYIWVEATPITESWIYWNEELGLISLSSDGSTRYTIADKNLWANTVWSYGDSLTADNCWYYYQRWNCYGFPFTWPTNISYNTIDASTYWPWNYYSSSTWIWQDEWDYSRNDNLRWWATWTDVAMQWPCPSGFHIPKYDWIIGTIYTIWKNMGAWTYNDYMFRMLKMPPCWYIRYDNNKFYVWNSYRYYMSTQYNYYSWYYMYDSSNAQAMFYSWSDKWDAHPIRPFKNVWVKPDNTRTVLYQPS